MVEEKDLYGVCSILSKAPGTSFLRTLISFMKTSPSGPKYLPKAPIPNTIIFGGGILTYECWRHISIQTKQKVNINIYFETVTRKKKFPG